MSAADVAAEALPVCVVGSWHLAAVTAAGLAEVGHRVCGVDHDDAAIEGLAAGRSPVYEPDLDAQLERGLESGRLRFTTDFGEALDGAEIVFLAYDTPLTEDGVDVAPLFDIVEEIARAVRRDYMLLVGSQVPIGTSRRLGQRVRDMAPSIPMELACSPEFLRLGAAVELFRRPDRIVVGGADEAAAAHAAELFRPFERPILTMTLEEAEMVKHATNAFVASSVSFAGEIAQLCDELGADALPVGQALRLDQRIGEKAYVLPGLGFNGGTVARDVKVLRRLAAQSGRQTPLLDAVLEVNTRQNGVVVERLDAVLGGLQGATIGILGLTYKPQTSTLRSSLSLQVADRLAERGARVAAWDPIVPGGEYRAEWGLEPRDGAEELAEGADALLVMTPKEAFRELDLERLGERMKRRVLADPVGVFGRRRAHAAGFAYIAIGRGFAPASDATSTPDGDPPGGGEPG